MFKTSDFFRIISFVLGVVGVVIGVVDLRLNISPPKTIAVKKTKEPVETKEIKETEETGSDLSASKFPEEYVDANGLTFRLIKPGTFTMGNAGLTAEEIKEKYPNGILEHIEGATPHKVTLTKPFYMAKYETTVAEFKKFVDATGYVTTAEKEGQSWGVLENDSFGAAVGANWRNPGFPQDSTHPVVHISWDDATAYINWLNANAKYSEELGCAPFYRLPTEAEWEYACRAGTKTEFFWGTNEPTDGDGYLNAADASGTPNGGAWSEIFGDVWLFNDGYVATAPVGSFKPNAWGLYDMAGNACEWCLDWFTSYESEPQTDPTGPATGALRAMRGGSWCYSPVGCRSNSRFPPFPTHRSSDFGFRVVVERKR